VIYYYIITPKILIFSIGDHLQYKKGYVINTGSSIWGLDFVPKLASMESDPFIQYLAIGGYRGSTEEHIGMEEYQPTGTYKNCIQIWKLRLSVQQTQEDPILDLCLLHDYGVIYDIKWCPYGTYEEEKDNTAEEGSFPKLGILTFACGDGTIRTIVVPHPDAVRKHMIPPPTTRESPNNQTVYMNIKLSRCTFAIKGSNFMNLAWGGHKKIATGCNYGSVIIWDMQLALADNQPKLAQDSRRFVQLSILPLDASVKCLSWNGQRDPERLMVGGYDGKLTLVDINDPFMPMMIMRSRNVINTCAWNSRDGPMMFVDGEKNTRGYSFNEDSSASMFKFGDIPGFCWTMAISEHHGQFALGTSLGWLRTGNMYQTRSRKLVKNN
jgi:WD40 repeat protein